MLVYQLLYTFVFCVIFAWINSNWIANANRVKHFWNGLIHLVSATVGWIFFGWQVFFIILLNARVVFDTSLNLFRNLPLLYTPSNPKSIMDIAENFLFKRNKLLANICYIVLSIALNIWYL